MCETCARALQEVCAPLNPLIRLAIPGLSLAKRLMAELLFTATANIPNFPFLLGISAIFLGSRVFSSGLREELI